MTDTRIVDKTIEPLTDEAFAPFGVVLHSLEDGTPCTPQEASLDLAEGAPRFYLMRLEDKPPTFTGITRHRRTTQTLLSADAREWIIAVAPATDGAPDLDAVRAFTVPAGVAITMAKGTWHSGPFFEGDAMSFVNLELEDTNIVDHDTYRLDRELGVRVNLHVA
ncbi:ureidoglycolate lyase [Microbacterium sp. No. 7]|uniref:ureidoglycolate lyase n=1 Tax=Microbacterium sp. No. 7 TaxID=1714373 RepID=UPI0006CF5A67|nr:ureidoglycolate lyase [Microbacterium sp. No. 7]ALJ22272.1 hypothetical protein AOA12_21245 [Microbacterium sp. No. 7]